jgi:hypothetical protein
VTSLSIVTDVEQGDFPLDFRNLAGQGQLTAIGLLRHGTTGGKATVSMIVTLRDGRQVFAETTWALLKAAARALAATPIAAEEVDEP